MRHILDRKPIYLTKNRGSLKKYNCWCCGDLTATKRISVKYKHGLVVKLKDRHICGSCHAEVVKIAREQKLQLGDASRHYRDKLGYSDWLKRRL